MPRLQAIKLEQAGGLARELLDGAKKKMGRVPNLLKHLANSPAALKAYLEFSGALKDGAFPDELRECIALAVAEQNRCDYCRAAHTALGKMAGLSPEEMLDCRRGESADPRRQAAIRLARRILETRGAVSDDDLAAARKAGFDDAGIVEIVAVTVLNLYTNFINHVADTQLDFPAAPAL
ncbi:MAG: carboxymuconolactone decarboxylase family protein [Planctomycetes bacterium]|nr:carboxymuconolactone decarboxylase family protein [Planctomycetota bacterium]